MKLLFFGHRGWLASVFLPFLEKAGHEVVCYEGRVDDTHALPALLDAHAPDRVVCFVGRTHGPGIPTIDYLEEPGKLRENVRDNLYAPVSLAILCKERGIHMTYLGSGCIFDGAPTPYKETDVPDFTGSSYSTVKGFTDRLMWMFDNVLNVRIRMPVTDDLHPRNFIVKIATYAKVCSMPNSISVLPTLFPALLDMIERGHRGTINLVNPGAISHNEILQMYKETVDPAKEWVNFSLDEQHAQLRSKRSNNQLDTSLLTSMYAIPPVREAVQQCLASMAALRAP